MQKLMIIFTIITISWSTLFCQQASTEVRKISLNDYIDKMKAGWIGQMVGVGWGGPTEFEFNGKIVPFDQMPKWQSGLVNQHYQDDIYVEMTFLRTLERHGFDVSIRQAGIDFANSRYRLWHANKAGRNNLRSGIAPPFSGHPKYNSHADDIDYQIEADFAGLIAPGMPLTAIDLGEKFGRLMNYGDGLYGGQFVAGMYTEAFFETNIEKIIRTGLSCIPEGSLYHECISDVFSWYKENPDDWQKTWHLINEKYHLNPANRKFSCYGPDTEFNIDAKLNGAYIVMGLLYGKGDPDSTIIIATRCGQDFDCNPSNAGGILFTSLGYSQLPAKFKTDIDQVTEFSFTEYNFPGLIKVCETLARQAVIRAGGSIEKNAQDEEEFVIPLSQPKPTALEQCWQPTPITEDVNFSQEEMNEITIRMRKPEEYVRTWQVSGLFTFEGADADSLFDLTFAPEEGEVETLEWQSMPLGEDEYSPWLIELDKFFDREDCVAYLRTEVRSETTRQAILELGSDDGIKAWLNGELVHQNNIMRAHTAGEDRVEVTLEKGWNSLMLKITQGRGGWQASACFCDQTGQVLSGLKYRAD